MTATAGTHPPPLSSNQRFVRFALAKLLQLLAQNALVYGLFILLVGEHESAILTSAFVLTAILPSVLLSLPGGVVADALPRKFTITWTMGARVGIAWWLVQQDVTPATILLLALASWTVYQFFSPAEHAAVAALVSDVQMGSANAVLNGVSLVAQIVGAGAMAPLALKAHGADGLFMLVIAFFVAALALYVAVPDLTPRSPTPQQHVAWWRALPSGLRAIRADPTLVRIVTLLVVLDSALLVVFVAAPDFIDSVLRTAPRNAVYIAMPGALGIAGGLALAPALLKFIPPRVVAALGFALFVGVVLTAPFVREVTRELDKRTFLPLQWVEDWLRVRREIAGAALLIPFGGLGVSLVRVAARTAMYQRAPAGMVAQVFATQSALGSLAGLVPTLGAGLFVDAVDVRAALVVAGAGAALLGFWGIVGPVLGAVRRAVPVG